jgi:hypothetical protein
MNEAILRRIAGTGLRHHFEHGRFWTGFLYYVHHRNQHDDYHAERQASFAKTDEQKFILM